MLSGMTVPVDEVLPVSDLEPPRPSAAPRTLGIVVAVLLVAAIASALLVRGGDARSPEERFAAVPAAVAKEPFSFEMTMGGTIPGALDDFEITMTGAADPATGRTKAEMDMSAIIPAGMGIPSKISMVSEGAVAYVLMPPAAGAAPQWTKVDATQLTQGAAGGGLPSSTNPLDSFDQLRSVGSEIEEVGEEEVRGTKTTHYRATIDMQKVVDAMPPGQRPATVGPLAAMGAVPVDVWLDDDDRPRRQRMRIPLPGGAGEMTITIEAFDFGKPVDIELPPADQIVDGSGLLGQPPR